MSSVLHEHRRRRIAEAAVDIIAREGLEAATIRRIAAEVGFSTTIVTHYFADKHELLLWAYQALSDAGYARIDAVLEEDPADLVGVLTTMAAADRTDPLWRAYIAFWDQAVRDPALAERRRREMGRAFECIARAVRARNGERADVEALSRLLNALVQGISMQALADPGLWSTEQIRELLADQVGRLLGPANAR